MLSTNTVWKRDSELTLTGVDTAICAAHEEKETPSIAGAGIHPFALLSEDTNLQKKGKFHVLHPMGVYNDVTNPWPLCCLTWQPGSSHSSRDGPQILLV